MKCIRRIGKQEIRRVTDNVAEKLVSTKAWCYCPKKDWKVTRKKEA